MSHFVAGKSEAHSAHRGDRQGRISGLSRRTVALALVLLAVGAGIFGVRVHHAERSAAAAELPILPLLDGRPLEFIQRIRAAHAVARNDGGTAESLAELGRLFHANGFFAQADVCWRRLAGMQPRNARWRYYLADGREARGDPDTMIEELNRTVALAPTYAAAWLRLADASFKKGDMVAAERAYRSRLQALPEDPYARLGLARLALHRNARDVARVELEQVIAVWPKFSAARNLYAQILAEAGESARAEIERVRGRDSGRFRAAEDPWKDELIAWCFDYDELCRRATIDFQTKHGDWGVKLYERAIHLRPNAVTAYELLAAVQVDRGELEKARQLYERALQVTDGAQAPPSLYAGLSRVHRLAKRPADAVALARQGLGFFAGDAELHEALGLALAENGETEAAISALRQAIAHNPRHARILYNMAVSLIANRELEPAVDALHRAIDVDAAFPPALALLAQIEIDSGRWEPALGFLERLYVGQPDLPEARTKMVDCYFQAGVQAEENRDFAGAEKHYRAALAIDGQRAELLERLGVLCLLQRRFSEAIQPLETLRSLQPGNASAALFVGQAYAGVGRRDDARRAFALGADLAERAGNQTTAQHCRDSLRRLR